MGGGSNLSFIYYNQNQMVEKFGMDERGMSSRVSYVHSNQCGIQVRLVECKKLALSRWGVPVRISARQTAISIKIHKCRSSENASAYKGNPPAPFSAPSLE